MRIRTVVVWAVMAGLAGPVMANDMFQISWKGSVHFTDESGNVVSRSFSDKDVVRVLAEERGLDPRDLVLVYRPAAFDTAVVFKNLEAMNRAGASDQVVSDYQQMPDISQPDQRTDVSNASGSEIVRQAFLFDEDHGISPGAQIGSIFGTERQKHDQDGNLSGESFHGTFQFAIPEADGRWQQGVYSGNFSTGKRINDVSGN